MSSSKRNAKKLVVRMEGGFSTSLTLVLGVAGISVDTSLAPRLTAVAGAYEYYRFTKLRFRQRPGSLWLTGISADRAVGFSPTLGAGTTYANVKELQPVCHFAPSGPSGSNQVAVQTVPSEWVNVPKQTLLGRTPTRWWKVAADAENPEVTQGQLRAASDSVTDVGTCLVEYQYECEFTGVNA